MLRSPAGLQEALVANARRLQWMGQPAELRTSVKNGLVQVLGCEDERVALAGALCIAKLGSVELTGKAAGWPELVAGLSVSVMSPTVGPVVRSASVAALGYLCEEITDLSLMADEEVDKALFAIVKCMGSTEVASVRLRGTEAMLHATDFCRCVLALACCCCGIARCAARCWPAASSSGDLSAA